MTSTTTRPRETTAPEAPAGFRRRVMAVAMAVAARYRCKLGHRQVLVDAGWADGEDDDLGTCTTCGRSRSTTGVRVVLQ